MDPLSLTASVIAVIGAAQQIGKGLTVLKTTKDAPQGLDDLLSDVSRFESVLEAIKDACPNSERDTPALMRVLNMAEGKLLEINRLVQYSLTKAGESSKVDRWQWLKRGNEAGKLRDQLCGIQADLTALISSNSFATLQQVSITSQISLHEQQRIRQQINGTSERQEAMFALLCAKIEQSSLARNQQAWQLGVPHQSYTGIDEAVAKPGLKNAAALVNKSDKRPRLQSKSVIQLSRCRKPCRCSCHQSLSFHVARVGSLEISGFRFPNSCNDCDVQSCEGPNLLSIKASICLPAWVARRMLSLWFTSSPLQGPELLLRVPRMVSRKSSIMNALHERDLSSFKRLVAQGEGSPYDVDEDGYSFTSRVLIHSREPGALQLLAYLLDLDVELAVCHRVWSGLTLSAACSYLIYCSDAMQYRDFEPCLAYPRSFDWDDVCEEMGFSELHKVVFGLSHKSLDAHACSHAQDLDRLDLLGHTALYDACSFGREDHTRVLLSHGADPNVGVGGLLPLVAAIRSESRHCVKLLLEHGAEIPVQMFKDACGADDFWNFLRGLGDLWNYIRGSYEFAEADQMVDIDKLLLEHGFNFDIQDGAGYTALMLCCKIVPPLPDYFRSYFSFRKERLGLLLEIRVDMELTDWEGNTAISHAVINANASAFNDLVRAGARLSPQTCEGLTILHLAVLYADNLDIVQALINTSTDVIELEAQDIYGYSAFDLMRQRVRRIGNMMKRTENYDTCLWITSYKSCPKDETRDIYVAETPEEEAEILAAFDVLFLKLQDERNVPLQARYPTIRSLVELVENEERENSRGLREMDSIPGAWLE